MCVFDGNPHENLKVSVGSSTPYKFRTPDYDHFKRVKLLRIDFLCSFFYRLWPVTVSDDWIRILGLCFGAWSIFVSFEVRWW